MTLRPSGDRQDWYLFGYGHDYKRVLSDFIRVAGKIPLPPRFAFGAWWSRYWSYTDQEYAGQAYLLLASTHRRQGRSELAARVTLAPFANSWGRIDSNEARGTARHTATGLASTSKTIDLWAMSCSREKIEAPAMTQSRFSCPSSIAPDGYVRVPPYTVVSLTSRDGGSVGPRSTFWSAGTSQNNRSINKGCWPPARRGAECNASASMR